VTERPIHPDVDLSAVNKIWREWEREPEPEVEQSVEEILDRNYYETISSYDPRVGLDRWLRLRVRGPDLPVGQLDTDAVQRLLRALHTELQGAAHQQGQRSVPAMRLAGLSSGSAVLHLAPAIPEEGPDEDQLAIATDQLDALMATVTDLHNVAEDAGDLRRFADHETLLKGLREMVSALDSHDMELDLIWRNAKGQRRTSHLTRHARDYVRSQWEEHEQSEVRQLTGRLTAIDLNGTITLKRAAAPRRTYEIKVSDEETLLGLGLELGRTYAFEVESVIRRNRAGIEYSPSYRLIRISGKEDRLI
jgi:hypothetical protein